MAKKVTEETTIITESINTDTLIDAAKLKERLSKFATTDLLGFKEMVDIAYDYYENMSQATIGEYTDYTLMDHDGYEALRKKYLKVQGFVFDEIKTRVDAIC